MRNNMHASVKSETSAKKSRSRITNGRSMFPRTVDGQSIDMRGRWTRRLRDLVRPTPATQAAPTTSARACARSFIASRAFKPRWNASSLNGQSMMARPHGIPRTVSANREQPAPIDRDRWFEDPINEDGTEPARSPRITIRYSVARHHRSRGR